MQRLLERVLRAAVRGILRAPDRSAGSPSSIGQEGLESLSEELETVLAPVSAPEAFRQELRHRLFELSEEPSSPWRRSRIVALGAAVIALSAVIAVGRLVSRLLRRDGKAQTAS